MTFKHAAKHAAWIFALAGALALPAFADEAASPDGPPVPIVKAPFHLPVFKNDYVTLLNIFVPPGRTTGYHIHTGDSVSVNLTDATMTNQDFGAPKAGPPGTSKTGRVTYFDFRKKSKTHKAVNVGTVPFHNISFIFNDSVSRGFTPSTRAAVPAYVQVLDNDRVRGWRLTLEPGQSAAPITQTAPGLRVVVEGGDITESVPGQADRAMHPETGEFFWQDQGTTRAIRNTGTSRVELVEFELK
jgi:hypothetical protein